MNKILLAAFCLTAMNSYTGFAQRKCGNSELLSTFKRDDPSFEQKRLENLEKNIPAETTTYKNNAKSTATPVIPVVFHIILNAGQISAVGGVANLQQRCIDQIDRLNKDYNRGNKDSVNIPSVFKPYYANVDVKFGLARRTPGGQATPGYEIKTITGNGFSGVNYAYSDAKSTTTNGLNSWNGNQYLNVWVINPTDDPDILGVAFPPSFGSQYLNQQGVVINFKAFGNKKSTDLQFITGIDSGRTLVHEIGHYFELEHTFGQNMYCPGNGDVDDGIADTPPEDNAKYYDPTFPLTDACSSGNGVMFMNYMNYANDKSMVMFTTGQKNLMVQKINGQSVGLTQHPELLQWPTDVASVEVDNPFNIFPNPSSGKFTLSFASIPRSLLTITVMNVVGQKVQDLNYDSNSGIYNINITGMSKGIYFVQCHFEEGVVTRKIVVE